MKAVTQESLEPVLFDLILEGAAADSQDSSRKSPILVRFIQSIDNHLFFSELGKSFNFFFESGSLGPRNHTPYLTRHLVEVE